MKDRINFENVTEKNQLSFLIQEASYLGYVLQIKPVTVKIEGCEPTVQVKEEGRTVIFPVGVNTKDALVAIAVRARQLWNNEHGGIFGVYNVLGDSMVFAAAYLMNRHKFNGAEITVNLPEIPEVESCINSSIQREWAAVALSGNGYDGRNEWIQVSRDVQHSFL